MSQNLIPRAIFRSLRQSACSRTSVPKTSLGTTTTTRFLHPNQGNYRYYHHQLGGVIEKKSLLSTKIRTMSVSENGTRGFRSRVVIYSALVACFGLFLASQFGYWRTSTETKVTAWASKDGEFRRQASSFRDSISSAPDAQFPPEKGRYHLYVSYACPWATRTLIVRQLKGLEDIISFSVVHWHLGEKGWRFAETEENIPDAGPDDLNGAKFLREIYFSVNPDYTGRFTVPVLWDKKLKTIVNNESSEIIRMLYTEFDGLVADEYKNLNFYSPENAKEIDEMNDWIYDTINNGVYKSGFATTQEAYERNVLKLFESLDRVEEILKKSDGPYLLGKTLTEADIRLFPTIIRFDPVYVQHFKCNIKMIRHDYPVIHKWMQHLYWDIPAFKDTCNFEHIKKHYTKSHTQINPFSITPVGPVPDILPKSD